LRRDCGRRRLRNSLRGDAGTGRIHRATIVCRHRLIASIAALLAGLLTIVVAR
jgi:hypothetical protein